MAKAFSHFFLFFLSLKGGVSIDCLLLILILNFWRTGADPRTAGRERTLGPHGRERTLGPHGRERTQGPQIFFEDPFYFSFVVLCGMRKNIWPRSFLFAFFTDVHCCVGRSE